MTEAGGALTASSLDSAVPTFNNRSGVVICSVGKLLPSVVSRVVKEDGSMACQGEQGELWVQTPSVAMGYAGHDGES
jgi:long-subunit acyl-CoA synthetase (AMP-forming)